MRIHYFHGSHRSCSCALLLCLFVVVALTNGCITADGGGFNALSTDDEIDIGNKLSAEVEKKEKVLNDPVLQDYVRKIGERIARQSPRQDIPYRFTVIDNPKTINAFALPGGHMYIYTGLLGLCSNEAELASVMGHELGHVTAHHHGQALARANLLGLLVGVGLGPDPKAGAQFIAETLSSVVQLRFSREQEYQADKLGMDFLFRAGYRPDAMIDFMRKMSDYEQKRGGGGPGLTFLSTHPATAERVNDLQALAQQYPPDLRAKSPVYGDRYRSIVYGHLK